MASDAAPAMAGQRMHEAAAAWLEALDAAQRTKASFGFDDVEERTSWAYFPRNHSGLPLLEMTAPQQKLAHVLIAGSLSPHAYAQATAIMALESVLNLMEGRRADAVRDPGRYFISIFGTPRDARWGWRLEGHHVVLNFALVDGQVVSPTPNFFGANPAEVRHAGRTVTRPCAAEEEAARALLASFDGGQRAAAVICDVAPPDFVLMNLPSVPESMRPGEAGALPPIQRDFDRMDPAAKDALRFERGRPRGLSATSMSPAQRAVLWELIDVYIARLPDDLSAHERSMLAREDAGEVHFAWAGSDRRAEGHYYRVQGPGLLVEYDNTQDGANHVHAVWRNPERDFGADALRSHLRRAH